MRAEQMASPVLLTPVSVEQLKVWGCFSPSFPQKYRLQTWQEVKYLRGKKEWNNCSPAGCSSLSWCMSRRVFTWTRAGNHPAPEWIISAIITRLNVKLRTALSRNAIKNNRCWKCLGGTEIKDYFVILGLLQAQLCYRFILSSTARVMWGLIFLWLGSFGTSAFDREWMLFNLRRVRRPWAFPDTPCPHNL